MKKMLLATALALLITVMCLQQTFTVQNKPAAENKGNHHLHHFPFLELGRRKPSMQPKFVAAQKMLLAETQQTFVNGLLWFYYFRHLYSAGSACVLLNNQA